MSSFEIMMLIHAYRNMLHGDVRWDSWVDDTLMGIANSLGVVHGYNDQLTFVQLNAIATEWELRESNQSHMVDEARCEAIYGNV